MLLDFLFPSVQTLHGAPQALSPSSEGVKVMGSLPMVSWGCPMEHPQGDANASAPSCDPKDTLRARPSLQGLLFDLFHPRTTNQELKQHSSPKNPLPSASSECIHHPLDVAWGHSEPTPMAQGHSESTPWSGDTQNSLPWPGDTQSPFPHWQSRTPSCNPKAPPRLAQQARGRAGLRDRAPRPRGVGNITFSASNQLVSSLITEQACALQPPTRGTAYCGAAA